MHFSHSCKGSSQEQGLGSGPFRVGSAAPCISEITAKPMPANRIANGRNRTRQSGSLSKNLHAIQARTSIANASIPRGLAAAFLIASANHPMHPPYRLQADLNGVGAGPW